MSLNINVSVILRAMGYKYINFEFMKTLPGDSIMRIGRDYSIAKVVKYDAGELVEGNVPPIKWIAKLTTPGWSTRVRSLNSIDVVDWAAAVVLSSASEKEQAEAEPGKLALDEDPFRLRCREWHKPTTAKDGVSVEEFGKLLLRVAQLEKTAWT